ncbi:amidohydrolase family protein [Geodermatophilus sabuli]|uniref:Cytosine/adenosine deaminase n=1 Tax=Geodermatophilus sabuli TaxID=1564158 RepID=A0A285EJP8_9ACTN|nr:amidohydrolase family protein [Geodermatophilus sabuli]MBB3083653.1 cytosine/adenosine deaminase-related metal-dependent hydrolase [Geodermatophilus sabuli]SNX99083.1 Cytosine/adenosine deaminase [Geodermatophilus sabuli]
MTSSDGPVPVAGRPVVLRGGTVLTMDDACTVLADADVLVVDDRIAAVGPRLEVPEGTQEIDASGGVVMPGMIDTHRHMWQTAMRGYGADWTLTQYFVWYYLEHGKKFRPEDIAAGNRLAAIESLDAGVTTTVDWSHNLHSVDHAEAALDALRSVPGRFVLAYGNIQAGPWEWTADPAVRSFLERLRDARDDMMGVQIAFDVTGDPAFPEKAAFEVARDLGLPVTTHAGVWGATSDTGIQQMYDNGFMTPETTYVHASTLTRDSYQRIAATGGSISVATESECSAGQGHAPTEQVLQYGIPVSLSMDTSVWWSGDMFSAMRATLNADRMSEHLTAHLKGETITHLRLRAQQVVEWTTRGGAHTIGRDSDLGSLEPGKKADLVLVKNDDSPVSFPLLNPLGHVVFQAQRSDVHTVVVDGRVVKYAGKLVGIDLAPVRREIENTIDFLRAEIGEEAWQAGMFPDKPEAEADILDNPYQYSDFKDESKRAGGEDRVLGR